MKKTIILSLVFILLAFQASAYKQEDLDKLKATNACEECDLTKANLREARLTKANLNGAYLNGANLRGANLRDAYLVGADLRDAYLRFAYLQEAKLRFANLFRANLLAAYLTGIDEDATTHDADLTWATLSPAIFCRTIMPDMKMINDDC